MPAASRSSTQNRHIFISHSSEDAEAAEKVCRALESSGLATWICSRDIQPGQTWAGAISDGLERSGVLVLLFTANANRSDHVLREVDLAVKRKVPILPVRLDNTPLSTDIEYYINVAHWIAVSDGQLDAHLDKITDGCRHLLAPSIPQPQPAAASRRKKTAAPLVAARGPDILVPRHHTATTPETILRLVDRFEQHREAYKTGTYNEAHVRRDFIDPFFTELGWDVTNRAGYAEAYRDVIHEDSVKVAGSLRAPDYGFRIGGQRKFFLEAKKPSIRVKDEIDPAYQLRRYAWSAKLPLSVLTDFEEFAVYDCRLRPLPTDPASKSRIIYYTFDSYPEKWEEIASVFAKDAVLKGSFDKFATTAKGKRGTSEVDNEFLATIEEWRADLARNLALRNALLSQREINFAVQRIIDRIIFLRICEDRGSEDYGRLRRLTESKDIYPQLVALFRQADTRYNSGLFHFSAERGRLEAHDTLTPGLSIDDALLKKIIRGLYYPDSPYQFDVISADILGQVYEQFLGKVIRLTDNHQAKIEEKPEVKKAGGVYYTPTYIVDYIVKETVGPLIDGKTPKQIAEIRVLDPACGSGSFLIGAYQFLLDWYLNYYTSNEPERWAKGKNPALVPGKRGGWVLSIPERKRILTAHIHGVDIDSQAVEVTKLSLLLKVLEGETALNLQPELIQERVLPDLTDNIKCGNSLIGSDFYAQPDLPEMDSDARLKINVFDWNGADGFPEIMKSGGFDAVIGNPPYIRIQTIKDSQPEAVSYFSSAYKAAAKGNYDIYTIFIEKGLAILKGGGELGFIVPHKFFNSEYGESLRSLISSGRHNRKIVHFGDEQIFGKATTYTCLLFLQRGSSEKCDFVEVSNVDEWRLGQEDRRVLINADRFSSSVWNIHTGPEAEVLSKVSAQQRQLKDIASLFVGLQTDADDVFILEEVSASDDEVICRSKATGKEHSFELSHVKPFLKGSLDIRRYGFSGDAKRLIFPYVRRDERSELLEQTEYARTFPKTWAYLLENKARLSERAKGSLGDKWHGYVYKKNHLRFDQAKILAPAIAQGACFAWDESGSYYFVGSGGGGGGGYGIVLKEGQDISMLALLGLLNSRVATLFLKKNSTQFRGGYIALNRQYIESIPVPDGLGTGKQEEALETLVRQMIKLRGELAAAQTPHEQKALERQIAAIDQQIDAQVYKLYGLTEDEIKIVEAAS